MYMCMNILWDKITPPYARNPRRDVKNKLRLYFRIWEIDPSAITCTNEVLSSLFSPRTANLFISIFHSFQTGIANAISSFWEFHLKIIFLAWVGRHCAGRQWHREGSRGRGHTDKVIPLTQ